MCGIVGYIGTKEARKILLDGLKRLEYRGYDSAGVAVHDGKNVHVVKTVGKVKNLVKKNHDIPEHSTLGIAHTRWATHGQPHVRNAHPHTSGKITLVHNGIIENYQVLRDDLIAAGHVFVSETDSEVVAHLIDEECKQKDFDAAVFAALSKLKGAFALTVLHEDEPEKLIAVRMSSPLVLGVGEDEFIFASDASAIVAHTKKVVYLNDGDVVIATPEKYSVFTLDKKRQKREEHLLDWDDEQAQKEGFEHFMLKEIHDQPYAVEDAMRGRTDLKKGTARLAGLDGVAEKLQKVKRIVIVSCGTSHNAGLVGEYMLEEFAGIPTEVEYASEFRYRQPLLDADTAVIAISQSGETADTLAAVREAKQKGALTLGIVNAVGSTIARETDAGIYNHAGPEIGVASTKAFVSQMTILVLLTVMMGRNRGMSLAQGKEILEELWKMPALITKILKKEDEIKKIAKKYAHCEDFFYLGRKYNYPIAIEGALKVKEIAYTHAEGYPAGEMKHGPIALIDKNFPSVVLAPRDSVYEKTMSAIEEIKARSGKVIAITTVKKADIAQCTDDVIEIPETMEMLMPFLTTIPLQIFAYYVGVERGYDVDKPRNLAKSVTVE